MSSSNAIAVAVAPVADAIVAAAPVSVRPTWYAVNRKADAPEEAEVLIYDEIGAWGVDAKAFAQEIRGLNVGRINVRLNTPGGSVFDGTAIHNALRSHPARIVMHIEGVAASAGSFIMLAGDEINMADNAYVMIHNSAGGVQGGKEDMRGYAELLEKIDGNIAMMYSAKTGKPPEHYRKLMDAETWFTAAEAKAEGLVDTVYTAKPARAPVKAASYTTVYNKIPAAVMAAWGNPDPKSPAPEGSQRSEPPPATTKETSHMANDPTQAAPAQNPAAGNNANPQGNSPAVTVAEARHQQLVQLNQSAIEGYMAQGRTAGMTDGRRAEQERAKAIAAACPGKPEMALNAILNNHSPESVSLSFAAATAAEARATEEIEAKNAEIARWQALAANGGYPAGVSGGYGGEPAAEEESGGAMDSESAKARATQEWDHRPAVRRGFTTKDRYVNARVAELTGQLRVGTVGRN